MKSEETLADAPLVRIEDLSRSYRQARGWLREPRVIRALDGIELAIMPGSTVALVGESGSGKSTLARCLALHERPDSGSIHFGETDLLRLDRRQRMLARRQIQLVFQDPASALNPRFSAVDIVSEPLRIHQIGGREEQQRQALKAMDRVGLLARWADRRPGELSGGQRQRLAIARALVLNPGLLILDEALSALDLSVQAQIVNLLSELQSASALTYLFISHDLSMVGYLADEVVVLCRGRIVERARPSVLFAHPRHPHTRALLDASPVLGRSSLASSSG